MAKVNTKKFQDEMRKVIDTLSEPVYMRQFGEYARDRIVKRTRLGKGVDERGGEPFNLEPLSKGNFKGTKTVGGLKGKTHTVTSSVTAKGSYVDQRKRLKKQGKLSPLTTPGKSNLTQTGQMLDSISVKAEYGSALISPSGGRKESDLSNKDVAGYVSDKRPFLNLSRAELKGLSDFIRAALEKIVKRTLT